MLDPSTAALYTSPGRAEHDPEKQGRGWEPVSGDAPLPGAPPGLHLGSQQLQAPREAARGRGPWGSEGLPAPRAGRALGCGEGTLLRAPERSAADH